MPEWADDRHTTTRHDRGDCDRSTRTSPGRAGLDWCSLHTDTHRLHVEQGAHHAPTGANTVARTVSSEHDGPRDEADASRGGANDGPATRRWPTLRFPGRLFASNTSASPSDAARRREGQRCPIRRTAAARPVVGPCARGPRRRPGGGRPGRRARRGVVRACGGPGVTRIPKSAGPALRSHSYGREFGLPDPTDNSTNSASCRTRRRARAGGEGYAAPPHAAGTGGSAFPSITGVRRCLLSSRHHLHSPHRHRHRTNSRPRCRTRSHRHRRRTRTRHPSSRPRAGHRPVGFVRPGRPRRR